MKIQSGNSITPGSCDAFYMKVRNIFKTSSGSKSIKGNGRSCMQVLQIGWKQGFVDWSVRSGVWGMMMFVEGCIKQTISYNICAQAWDHSPDIEFLITDSNGLGRFRLHYFRTQSPWRLQIGSLWTDMCWNGGEGNSLLAQVLRNQVSLPRVSRWPKPEPARQALDPRWDTYSSTSHKRPWVKNFEENYGGPFISLRLCLWL